MVAKKQIVPAHGPVERANGPIRHQGGSRTQQGLILIFWIVAACYAYGALVHVMNMFGLMGFHWPQAPLKWQVLDVTYLVLDLVVAVGFILAWKASYVAFYGAALSQVLLYTVFRRWILDVPPQFAVAPDQFPT